MAELSGKVCGFRFLCFKFCFVVLDIKPRVISMLGKSTSELAPAPV